MRLLASLDGLGLWGLSPKLLEPKAYKLWGFKILECKGLGFKVYGFGARRLPGLWPALGGFRTPEGCGVYDSRACLGSDSKF